MCSATGVDAADGDKLPRNRDREQDRIFGYTRNAMHVFLWKCTAVLVRKCSEDLKQESKVANSIAAPFADWSALGALGADALGLVAQFTEDQEAECAILSRAKFADASML